jgi:cytochrome P450
MSREEIHGNSSVLIIAGSETTATALSGITYYLGKHPSLMQTVVNEVRSKFSTEEELTMDTTTDLPYMRACIEESLRLFPPVPISPPRLSPGGFVGGYYLPRHVSPNTRFSVEGQN